MMQIASSSDNTKLDSDGPLQTAAGRQLYCGHCGGLNKVTNTFCRQCGRKLLKVHHSSEPQPPEPGPAPIIKPEEAAKSPAPTVPSTTVSPSWENLFNTSGPPLPLPFWQENKRLAVLAGVSASLVLLVALTALVHRTPSHKPRTSVIATPALPTPPAGMAYIPNGTFTMGRIGDESTENPPHKVTVSAFYLDLYEVTCAEYAKFSAATGHAVPATWADGKMPPERASFPVTGVNWDDAGAYAHWAGKRLPTEEEWEYAARGTDERLYPWGNEWCAQCANAGKVNSGTVEVGHFPDGKSPFGVFDLVGNAWEWTSSTWQSYPGGAVESSGNDAKVIRGGYFESSPNKATATFRRGWPARDETNYNNTGFRCAQDVLPVTK